MTRRGRRNQVLWFLLAVGLLGLMGCRPRCRSPRAYQPVLDWFADQRAATTGRRPVKILAPARVQGCLDDVDATFISAPSESSEILQVLERSRPAYVLAEDAVSWDEVRSQGWFVERYRRVAQWRGLYPQLGSRTLFTYVPSTFDLGEARSVHGSFDTEAVVLRAFRVGSRYVEPGVPLSLSFYWDDLPGGDFHNLTLTLDLVERGSGPSWLTLQDAFEPTGWSWEPDHRLARRYVIVPPDDLPEGAYDLRLQLHERSGRPVTVGNGEATALILTQLSHPPDVSRSAIAPAQAADYGFGDPAAIIGLRGYDAPPWGAQGQTIRLALLWEAFETPRTDLHVFVHLVNDDGELVSQSDGVPVFGFYPTSSWTSGDHVRDVHTLRLPDDLPPDLYTVIVGLYEPDAGYRMAASDSQGVPLPMDQVPLHTLIVYPDL